MPPPNNEQSSLDRKATLIANISIKNYGENYTSEDYAFELDLAYKMLASLGINE